MIFNLTPQPSSGAHKMIVQSGRKIHFIDIDTISFIESCNYYALVHAGTSTYVIRQTLDSLEQMLVNHFFLRVHRSVILNRNIFQRLERKNKTVIVSTTIGKEFKVSRHRVKALRSNILA